MTINVLLILLCLASGLQNAAITSSSNRSVRTTHLTGLTTGWGVGLALVATYLLQGRRNHAEERSNALRFGSILFLSLAPRLGLTCF